MSKAQFGSKPSVLRCSRCGKFVDWEDSRLQIVCGCRPHVQLPPVDVREAGEADREGIARLFLRDFGAARVAALGVEFQDGSVPAFVAEMAEPVSDGRLSFDAGKGVNPGDLTALDELDRRSPLRICARWWEAMWMWVKVSLA